MPEKKNISIDENFINKNKNLFFNNNDNINNFPLNNNINKFSQSNPNEDITNMKKFDNLNNELNENSQSSSNNEINNQNIWIAKEKKENENTKNEALPKKPGQIYLKVKKCVAPEI